FPASMPKSGRNSTYPRCSNFPSQLFVPANYVFLHSRFAGSYDSRYFGPVPASGILGLAQEVLTYEP
ncbi:conjugal transfer protein TraF, partial [Sinorhizobium medicae]|nr:conjugal transfer protein TraF [Sinorhizobium medicae]MDX0797173.1 conjugal transfer protein TraF [Sinorhizobium medicae]